QTADVLDEGYEALAPDHEEGHRRQGPYGRGLHTVSEHGDFAEVVPGAEHGQARAVARHLGLATVDGEGPRRGPTLLGERVPSGNVDLVGDRRDSAQSWQRTASEQGMITQPAPLVPIPSPDAGAEPPAARRGRCCWRRRGGRDGWGTTNGQRRPRRGHRATPVNRVT